MNRPRVVTHTIASVDGRITLAPDVLLLYEDEDERWRAVEWPTRLRLISAQVHADGRVWLRYEVVPEYAS